MNLNICRRQVLDIRTWLGRAAPSVAEKLSAFRKESASERKTAKCRTAVSRNLWFDSPSPVIHSSLGYSSTTEIAATAVPDLSSETALFFIQTSNTTRIKSPYLS